jgi:hypothetical protein
MTVDFQLMYAKAHYGNADYCLTRSKTCRSRGSGRIVVARPLTTDIRAKPLKYIKWTSRS